MVWSLSSTLAQSFWMKKLIQKMNIQQCCHRSTDYYVCWVSDYVESVKRRLQIFHVWRRELRQRLVPSQKQATVGQSCSFLSCVTLRASDRQTDQQQPAELQLCGNSEIDTVYSGLLLQQWLSGNWFGDWAAVFIDWLTTFTSKYTIIKETYYWDIELLINGAFVSHFYSY